MNENIEAVAARMELAPEQVAALHKMSDVAVNKQLELYTGVHSAEDMARANKQIQAVIYARARAEYRVLKSDEKEHMRYQRLRSAASQGILDQVNDDGLPGTPGQRHVPSSRDLSISEEGAPTAQ